MQQQQLVQAYRRFCVLVWRGFVVELTGGYRRYPSSSIRRRGTTLRSWCVGGTVCTAGMPSSRRPQLSYPTTLGGRCASRAACRPPSPAWQAPRARRRSDCSLSITHGKAMHTTTRSIVSTEHDESKPALVSSIRGRRRRVGEAVLARCRYHAQTFQRHGGHHTGSATLLRRGSE